MTREFRNFIEFMREKGVVGMAIGIIIGVSITKVVASLVEDIINPVLGLVLGVVGNLSEQYLVIGKSRIGWGNFVNSVIDFVIIAIIVYYGVKILRSLTSEKKKNQDLKS